MASNMLSVTVCPACNSFDIRFDAYAEYDPVDRDYSLSTSFGNIVCETCGEHNDEAKWIESTPEQWENRWEEE